MTALAQPLLELLDGFVRDRPQPPGLEGYISVGIQADSGYRGWFAEFAPGRTRSGFIDFVPTAADTVVILGESEATSLMQRGTLGAGPTLAEVRGNRGLLEALVAQYLQTTNWLALRTRTARPLRKAMRR